MIFKNQSSLTPLIMAIALTGGCAVTDEKITPAEPTVKKPAVAPVPPKPVVAPAPAKPAATPPKPVALPPIAALSGEQQAHSLLLKLLPDNLQDKEGWAGDMLSAFSSLQIQPTAEHFCAAIAIIEQESSFQADPVVPNLPGIVRQEIEQRRMKYSIPQTVVDWMLSAKSVDGRSYGQRIDKLTTEKELSDLVEEIVASIPAGKRLFHDYNPVHTGGPMQVSVEFAESQAREKTYPYPINSNLRNEVFSRRGGLYFGSAILFDYPAPYDNMIYRFADFNAGRYSCRNAAFQQALSHLTGSELASDGDLLRYKNGMVSDQPSITQNALFAIGKQLKMSEAEILRDLKLEKNSAFGKTELYLRLFALADQKDKLPRVVLPRIDLKSPKFQRKLTTEWFANRAYGRYKKCLKRS